MRQDRLKEKSRIYFDKVATEDDVIEEPVLCYEEVLRRLEEGYKGRLLDVGCGTGDMLRGIEKKELPFHLWGLDLSQEALRKAAASCSDSVTLDRGDAEHLPYEDGFFDLLICMHSFHHYPRPRRALQEMRRVLRANGTLILVENDYPPLTRLRCNYEFIRYRHPNGDVRMYAKGKLRRMMEKTGFSVRETEHIADHSRVFLALKKAEES